LYVCYTLEMEILDKDERNISLTPDFIDKSDKDLSTIKSLDVLARRTGNILVLSSGYATEALCGGNITRAHGDIDAHIILTGIKSKEKLFSGVKEIITKEDTKWKLRNKTLDKFEFIEEDKNKDFFTKRRLEVYLNNSHEYNTKYPKKYLFNSRGEKVRVTVVDLDEMVRQKIHKFYILRGGVDTSKDRHSSKSDFFDLKRLLALPEINGEEIKNKFPEEFNYVVSLMSKRGV
jgi:hypothetical protein